MNPFTISLIGTALIAGNGFFVAVEFALVASRRSLLDEMAEQGQFGAASALAGMRNLNVQLAATQLGVTVTSLLLGWLIEPVIGDGFDALLGRFSIPSRVVDIASIALALVLVALAHMVLGEMVPKSLALAAPERTAAALAPLHRAFVFVVRPVVVALYGLARAGTRLVGVNPTDELGAAHTPVEFAAMVEESLAMGELEAGEHELLTGALGFLGITVAEVMAPREQVATVPATATVAEAEELVHRSGHSRVLVVGADPDDVVGFLHAKDLLRLNDDSRSGLLPPGLVRVALRVAPGDRLPDVLPWMRRARRHVAVVAEGPRVLGLVTLEDILEAIVGDIRDESDRGSSDDRTGRPDSD